MALEPTTLAAWLREFQLNGFLVLRGFLPPEFVRELYEQLDPLLASEHRKAEEQGFRQGRGPGRLALDVGRWSDLLGGPLADPRYRRHPVIEELVDAILGAGQWKHGWSNVEAVWQGSAPMSWHSDQTLDETPDPDGPHRTVRVTYNIPLVEFTWANGATEYIPGSHRLSRRFLAEGVLTVRNLWPVRLDLAVGDAVLRDGNCLHRGMPNLTDRVRPMLDQTYRMA